MRLLAVLLGFIAALLPRGSAHDPFEAFHSATLQPDRLDLVVTMAQVTATRLVDPSGSLTALTPENLAVHRPRLLREGTALFTLTSLGKPLAARVVELEFTEENDLVFKLTYPRPEPGRLVFAAAYLKKLGDGYGGILELTDPAGRNLGWEQLLWMRPTFACEVPK